MKKMTKTPLALALGCGLLALASTAQAQTVWNADADGDFNTETNWDPSTVPDPATNVEFGDVITAPRTITLEQNADDYQTTEVRSLTFDNANAYTLSDGGNVNELVIGDLSTGSGTVTVQQGDHLIDVSNVKQNGPFSANTWSAAAGSSLRLTGVLENPSNKATSFTGGGTFIIEGGVNGADRNASISGNTTLATYDGYFVNDNRSLTLEAGSTLRGNGAISGQMISSNTTTFNLNGDISVVGDGGTGTDVMTFTHNGGSTTAETVFNFNPETVTLGLGTDSSQLVFDDQGQADTLTVNGFDSGTIVLSLFKEAGYTDQTFNLLDFSGLTGGAPDDLDLGDFTLDLNDGLLGSLQLDDSGDIVQFAAIPEPSSFALFAGALGLALVMIRRRRA